MLLNVMEAIDIFRSHKYTFEHRYNELDSIIKELRIQLLVYEDISNVVKEQFHLESINDELLQNKNKIQKELNNFETERDEIYNKICFIENFIDNIDEIYDEMKLFINYTELLLDIKLNYSLFYHENDKYFLLIINYYNPYNNKLLLFYPDEEAVESNTLKQIKSNNVKYDLIYQFHRTMKKIYALHDVSFVIHDKEILIEEIEKLKRIKEELLTSNIINKQDNKKNNIINPKDIL